MKLPFKSLANRLANTGRSKRLRGRSHMTRRRIGIFEIFEARRLLAETDLQSLGASNNDDIFANATSIGTLSSSRPSVVVDDGVGSNVDRTFDQIDHFRFAITSTSDVRINLSRHEGTVNLRLLDLRGNPVASHHVVTNGIDNLAARDLLAGRYVVELTKRDPNALGHLAYSLVVSLAISNDLPGAPTKLGYLTEHTPTVRLQSTVGGATDIQDYIEFSLYQTKSIRFSLSEMNKPMDAQLMRQSGYVLAGGRSNGLLITNLAYDNLPIGTYLLRLRPANPTLPTNYVFNITCEPSNDDVFGEATQLGVLSSSRPTVHLSNAVNQHSDPQDYYRFYLSSVSTLKINLGGMRHNLGIQILDRYSRPQIQQTLASGITLENITIPNMRSDFYYLRVFVQDPPGFSSYNLTLSVVEGDDLLTGASPIVFDVEQPTVLTRGRLTAVRDLQDHYQITTTEFNSLLIVLSGLSENADLFVLDTNGVQVAAKTTPTPLMESLYFYGIPAGTYIIRVFSRASTAYDLTISHGRSRDDTLYDPVSLGAISEARPQATSSGDFGTYDFQDYFVFQWSDTADITVTIIGMNEHAANVQVELLNPYGARIAIASGTSTTSKSLTVNALPPGRYYLRVFVADPGNTNRYDLSVLRSV